MKIIFTFILLTSVFCFKLMANEIEAEFFFDTNVQVLKEGDVANATLRVWPIENVQKNEFDKYLGNNLFESFYVAEIISSSPSVNNADVYELKVKLIILSKVNPEKMVFQYLDNNIHVKYHEVLFQPLAQKTEGFYILDQSLNKQILQLIVGFVLLAFLIAMVYFKRDKLSRIFAKKKEVNPKELYSKKFHEAKSREDFEWIYHEKKNWLPLLETKAPAHEDFFKVLNLYQYKKNWEYNEEQEVLETFDVIRGSFK